jgi:FtsP/CotA-like multicopper oxidase with cupredoxin domain
MTRGTRIALLVVAVLIVAGGIVLASTSGGDDQAGDTETTTQASQTTPTQTAEKQTSPTPRAESIRIRGGKPVGGPETLKYRKGDTVRLRITTDSPQEIHVHGYEKELAVDPGKPARLSFKANLEGVYEIESHTTEQLLAQLEVRP